ncbi:MAG: SDR family NAD(P)-dependent oxidoreductase [Sphaerochaetaceae bacterium]|nr:SDR family oxidoreductase [Sphaerochaetaceae bacterium]NLO60684.1 SDR family oxidoreductase [Spirochaetales bacterium]MDD2405383.1 SDR family NAD(P)-dependent oxidoreductase [Sphaerochaetaceae bacterium]MDD3669752.1 SDR family NAD(P)-dependent oxidoreductase [Sphaerochaetaceae bacterium]MDD4260417.1 SDR family NAD(P)-dependent oxidoreductase [Sphaerochaetaceae bacterium]
MVQLKDKVCVVTGSAKSIGFEIAKNYAQQGAKVALIDIDNQVVEAAKSLASQGYAAKAYVLDITDQQKVFSCFDSIVKDFGPVWCLVNNAGVVDQRPFDEVTPEQLDKIFKVNVFGTVYCSQAALKTMKDLGDGRIINFSSKSGKTGSALMAPYSAAKGAIIALTHALAFEYANKNIKVNCICPGITDATGVWANVSEGYTKNLNLPREEIIKKFTAKIPLGRLTRIEDVVELVQFITVSGDYCTGQAFNITGGREVH